MNQLFATTGRHDPWPADRFSARISLNRAAVSLTKWIAALTLTAVLAALGVPHLLQRREQARAAEAFAYLQSVQTAQTVYHQLHGAYATKLADLDPVRCTPTHFIVPNFMRADHSSWSLQLTRAGAGAPWGSYNISFGQNGFDPNPGRSNIPAVIHPGGA